MDAHMLAFLLVGRKENSICILVFRLFLIATILTVFLGAYQDDKDVKIRVLTAELQRERKRSAAIQEQLDMVLKDMEEHSSFLSRNIDDIVRSMKEIESKREVL